MQYLTNSEITKLYNVSFAAVKHWIDAARERRLDLQLHEQDGRYYIANTAKNFATMKDLVQERKKYMTNRDHKVVAVSPEFYQLFTHDQVLDIILNLDVHREIPLQYSYFDSGADAWEHYINQVHEQGIPGILNNGTALLHNVTGFLDQLLGSYKNINVIDVGIGNALPAKDLLADLIARGTLKRYVGVDISERMLQIAKRNITQWFGSQVPFEGHIRNVTQERFADLLVRDSVGDEPSDTVNLVLLLGGTPANFRSPEEVLRVVYGSMGRRDLLIYNNKIDSALARRQFDFDISGSSQTRSSLDNHLHKLVLKLLNIEDSFYELEQGFDEHKMERFLRLRLKVALTLRFEFTSGNQTLHLDRGETILLWRAKHQSALDVLSQLDSVGFGLRSAIQTDDYNYLLTVSGIKTNR